MSARIPEYRPDFICERCGTAYIVTGDTDLARARALRDWSCPCHKTPSEAGPTKVRGIVSEGQDADPSAVTTRTVRPAVGPHPAATHVRPDLPHALEPRRSRSGWLLARLFPSAPGWVERRLA